MSSLTFIIFGNQKLWLFISRVLSSILATFPSVVRSSVCVTFSRVRSSVHATFFDGAVCSYQRKNIVISVQHIASREKLRRAGPKTSSTSNTGPIGRDQGRASQFDPVIDKEKEMIINLRRNISVLLQIIQDLWLNSQ
jgi:hypothetical protein